MSRTTLEPGQVGEVGVALVRRAVDGNWKVARGARRSGDRYRARVRFRAWDGTLGEVSRMAARRPQAEAALQEAVAERLRPAGGTELTRRAPLMDAGRVWLEQIRRSDSGKSRSTVEQYSGAWGRYVMGDDSRLRALSLAQANDPQRLRLFLQQVADDHGTGASKLARTVLSGVIGLAVGDGVLEANAMRQVPTVRSDAPPKRPRRETRRTLTSEEESLAYKVAQARVDAVSHPRTRRARERARDLLVFLLGMGVRIGEGLAIRWEDVDLEEGRVAVHGTKTRAAERRLNLSPRAWETLRRMAADEGAVGLVFSSPGLQDPWAPWLQRTAQRNLRALLDEAGLHWVVSHTARKTVATKLDDAGKPVRRIADQLGHKRETMTLDVYLGRDPKGDKADLAAVL